MYQGQSGHIRQMNSLVIHSGAFIPILAMAHFHLISTRFYRGGSLAVAFGFM